MEKTMNFIGSEKGGTGNPTHHANNRSVDRKRSASQPMGSMQSSTATTNKGWDIVTSLGATALTYLSRKLMPNSFQLTINSNDYLVKISPEVTTCSALADNMLSVQATIDATPTASNPTAPAFNGTTTTKFDASKMIMNTVRSSNYLQLPSTGGYLTASATDAINGSTGFAMEAWINPDNSANTGERIISGYSNGGSPVFAFILSAGATKLGLRWGATSVYSSEIPNLTNGNWHHVAVSVASNVATFYVDGLPQGTANLTAQTISVDTFCIGYLVGDTATENLIGNLTNVRVWTASRTEAQVQTYMNINMANQSGAAIANLVQLWKFTDADLNKPTNLINGTVGTLNGDAAVIQAATTTKARYIINFTTTSVNLSVTSVLSVTNLEAEFNTALMGLINTKVFPYAQQLKATTFFQTYSGVITPTNTQFITLANTNSIPNQPYQLMALSMCYRRIFPSGDPATLFANDSTFMLPNDPKTNLIASVSDYQYLFTRQAALNKKAGANFQLVEQSDGTYHLQSSGKKRVGKWYYFTNVKSFIIYILTGSGVFRTLKVTSIFFNISKAQMVLQLKPQVRTGDGAQQIQRSYTDVDVKVSVNLIFFGILALILLLILVGLGALFGNIAGAIIGLVLWVFVMHALYGLFYSLSVKVQKLITDKMENYEANNVNTNANFTINTISFNQAAMATGLLGAASFDMSVLNPATKTPVVIYNQTDTLTLTFKNNYGDVKLSNDSTSPSVITITMPTFLQKAVAGMKLQGNASWQAGTTGTGSNEKLTLTNLDGSIWKKGVDLNFTIDNVYCDYLNKAQQPIASGAISAILTNTDYVNGTIDTAARISLQGVNPNSKLITYFLVKPNLLKVISQLDPPQAYNTSQRQFIQLYEVEMTIAGQTTTWLLGYKNVAKGMKAFMQQKDQPSINYSGQPIQYDPSAPDSSTTAYFTGGAGPNNPGITIKFIVSPEKE